MSQSEDGLPFTQSLDTNGTLALVRYIQKDSRKSPRHAALR